MDFFEVVSKELKVQKKSAYRLGEDAKKPRGWISAVKRNNSPTLKTAQQLTEALGGKITLTFENRSYELRSAVEEVE